MKNIGVGFWPGLGARQPLELPVCKHGRWVLTALPAKPPEPKPVQHYFPED